ncbi:hypothetical protein [Limosilactobacillus fermentum]|uniref:hypothetical protein n=1 Tax=Limosilactobacillus fermentum TaxID=1613 RepID=UPI002F266286
MAEQVQALMKAVKEQHLTVKFNDVKLQRWVAYKLRPVIDDTHKQLNDAVSDFKESSMKHLQRVTEAAQGAQKASEDVTARVEGFEKHLSKRIAPAAVIAIVLGFLGAGIGVFAFGASKVLSLLGLPALWQLAIAHGVHWWGVVIALVVTLVVIGGIYGLVYWALNRVLEWLRLR